MPTQVPDTSNHNLPKIPPLDSAYADEWGYILNNGEFADGTDAGADSLIDALEQRVPIVGDESTRSNYTAYTTAAFLAVDTGRIYVGDGTNWVRVQDPDKLDTSPDTVDVGNELTNPTYATLSDVPSDLPEGTQVYVKDESAVYIEDGT